MSAVGKQKDQTRHSLSAREKEERVRYSLSTHRYGVHCNRPGPAYAASPAAGRYCIEEVDFEADAEGFQWEVVKRVCCWGLFPAFSSAFWLEQVCF